MGFPWSGFTKKRNYTGQKDRLQYKDLRNFQGFGPERSFFIAVLLDEDVVGLTKSS